MSEAGIIVLAVVALVAIVASLTVVNSRMLPAASLPGSVLTSLAIAGAGALPWLVLAPFVAPYVGWLWIPIAAACGLSTVLATIAVRATGAPLSVTLLFGVVWSLVVLLPTVAIGYGSGGPLGLAPIDHGGSLVLNVASGAAALGVLVAHGSGPRARLGSLPLPIGVWAVIVLCMAWIAWLVSAEFAIDEATPAIVANAVSGAIGGVVGWLVVQRIRHRSTSLPAVAAGLVSGLASVTAGVPLFTPVSAIAAGVLAGAAACIFTLRRVEASRRQQWFIVGSHLVAGAVGLVCLGLLATGMGFLFTGQVTLVSAQVTSTVLVAGYSAAVSWVLWAVLRRVSARLLRPRHAHPAPGV